MPGKQKRTKSIQSASQHKRPTIGFFVSGRMNFGYNSTIFYGINDVARERGANLICFPGMSLKSPYGFDSQRNVLYDLAHPENVDGLIMMSGGLCNFTGIEKLKGFYKKYKPLPLVSIAINIEGTPSILIDNAKGLRDAIIHLIEVHGYRRIAFIRGPKGNPEAELRYRVFTGVMNEYKIPIDPELVLPGDFLPITGAAAIHQLLNRFVADYKDLVKGSESTTIGAHDRLKRRSINIPADNAGMVDFDAVVAANDNMAIGAMEELQSLGIRVPEDVAVVGFDDLMEARLFMPPITTVRQPFYEQGRRAAEILLAQISGQEVPQTEILPTQFVVRQSCGCLSRVEFQPPLGSFNHDKILVQNSITTRKKSIASDISREIDNPSASMALEQAEKVLDVFINDVTGKSRGLFLSDLQEVLTQTEKAGGNVAQWIDALYTMQNLVFPYFSIMELIYAESLLQQAQIVIGEKAQRLQAYQALQAEQRATALFEVGQVLITTFDLPELLNSIAQELPRLGIPSCYLSLYNNPKAPEKNSILIMAYNENGQFSIKHSGLLFPSHQLVPFDFKPGNRRFTWIIEALYFREEQIGFVVFEAGPKEGLAYETLRGQLSSALKGALLFQEHQKAQDALEIKAKELSRSNAELEQFAKIASHDLQEPLRKVLFFSDRLNSKYAGLIDEEGKDCFQRILGAVKRMQTLIDDLLSLSRVITKGQPLVHIDLRKAAEEAASDLEVLIEKTKGRVQIGDLPSIEADPVQIRQLFANLIGNSLKYHREGVPPVIKISSEIIHKKVNLRRISICSIYIQDNGIGFDEKYIELIFQPFQRLHGRDEFEGCGIGLAVCRKIVERHHGTITAKSRPGKGSTFTITLPVRHIAGY